MRTAIFKTYVFKEQDPIVGKVLIVIRDTNKHDTTVANDSGVSVSTLKNWRSRKTRRPQFATVNAVLRSCGKKLIVADIASKDEIHTSSRQKLRLVASR